MACKRTTNTNRSYSIVHEAMKFRDNVFPATEVYGPFGKSYGVFEHLTLGSDGGIYADVNKEISKHNKAWARLVWVRYE